MPDNLGMDWFVTFDAEWKLHKSFDRNQMKLPTYVQAKELYDFLSSNNYFFNVQMFSSRVSLHSKCKMRKPKAATKTGKAKETR